MQKIDRDKIHKILVVRTDRMGDTLLNIPAIRALKQTFNAFVVALVNPAVKDLLGTQPEIDQILTFDEKKWKKSILARWRLLWQIRKERFDLVVILNPMKRFHILSFLAGIPQRLGYDRKWGFLLTHKIKDNKFQGQKHEVEYNLDLVRSIGADTSDLHISMEADEKDRQFVEDLLLQHSLREKDLIVAVAVHSSNPAKCWPRENFAQLIDGLNTRFSAKVVIIGAASERSSAIKIISLAEHSAINFCGKLTLRELVAFLKRCSLLISNDSAPAHIAAGCNTPTIVIFGRNIAGVGPKRWGPWGQGHTVLHKDPGCKPCLDRDCPYNFKCLSLITPEEVLVAAEGRLNAHINR